MLAILVPAHSGRISSATRSSAQRCAPVCSSSMFVSRARTPRFRSIPQGSLECGRALPDASREPPCARLEAARRLWQLLAADSSAGASVYVCGRSGFARSVLDGLTSVFSEFATGSDSERAEQANETLYRLVANNRLLRQIHTDAQPANDEPRWIDVSEVAEHNGDGAGYWMVIHRAVYDLTEFIQLHPGGRRVVQAYAGMDATHGYARAHHQRPDVDAIREPYRIGDGARLSSRI